VSDVRLRAFLAESLELWGVEGTVGEADAPRVAEIRASDGTTISIERISEATMPFRWLVRRRAAGDASEERPRPYGSLVGVLNALRTALGVDRGSPVRIAATFPEA
jgi:hypothetical protein